VKRFALTTLAILLSAVLLRAQDKLEIHPRFTKGESHSISATLDQMISQTLGDRNLETRQTLQIAYSVTVDDLDERGVATLSVRYDSIRFNASGAAGKLSYDSQQPATSTGQVGISALVGQNFQATVSPIGVVQNIRGLDRLLAASMSQITLDEGPLRQVVEKTLRQQLDPANVKPMVQNLFGVLPDHAVTVGDTWPRHIDSHAGPAKSTDANYTLKARDNGMAIIALNGRLTPSPNAVIDAALTKVNYELSGAVDGEFQVQESTGWTWLATVNQSLTGSITVHAPSVAAQTLHITIMSKLKLEQK
jgi:hypothetical protein